RLRRFGPRVTLRQANFRELGAVLQELKIPAVDGILMDLGVSSHQIDTDYRGFSFMQAGPLDMRMNRRQRFGAYQVVNTYPESELRRIFYEYGEERRSAAIARAIVKARQQAKIDSTDRLAKIIAGAVPRQHLNKTLARIFQAIRIEVNAELTNLQAGLEQAVEHLRPGGRLVVISYHSLEDRIVKHFFRENERHCICPPELPQCVCGEPGRLRVLTRRPVVPSEEEIRRNPRARSAKLRVAEKLEEADSGQRD
ncbi:MAG TPA: 16S rRNA (cytosine(1402)-N(4))-methyltransferase RsmH, partial [Bacteroidetes bacterium]|nr:16S rRNA (cytosine(1402)-N(4))-methyltransferase RsmH [Bacteroidota bacterium]